MAAAKPQPVTRADHVAGYLVAYIRRNRLTSGTEVPSEMRLSQELDVSRGAVREACRSLASAGMLDVANGRAPRVGRLSGRAFAQFLQHGLSTAQVSQEQVFDVRKALEVRAAALAARHRTPEDVEALARAVADMRAAGRRRAPFIDADMRFHAVITGATGNPLFHLLAMAIRESLDGTIRAGLHSRRAESDLTRIVDVHAAIADAVAARQAGRAQKLMATHFVESARYVFGRGGPSAPRRGRMLSLT